MYNWISYIVDVRVYRLVNQYAFNNTGNLSSIKELYQDVSKDPSLGPKVLYQAFIEFFKPECAEKARGYLQGQMLNGIPMDLQWAESVKACKKCRPYKIKYKKRKSKEEVMMNFLKYKNEIYLKYNIICEYQD